MQQSKLRTVSPIQYQYVSTPSNCSVEWAFKRSKTLKTQSPSTSQHKKTLNNVTQVELDQKKNRCKEISIQVAKFLQQINSNESNFPSMYTSNVIIDNQYHEENQVVQQQMLQLQNQSLQKQSQIKKLEIDQFKQKSEQAAKQLNEFKTKYDEDIEILNKEGQVVNERITSFEQQRNQSFFDLRATGDNLTNISIQTFQRSINENENQIEQFKLLDDISEKNTIIKSLTLALEKTKIEVSEVQLRSNGEIEELKSKINQIEQQKIKMELFYNSEIQNIKLAYNNQIEILKEEISYLKYLLELKSQEIMTINNQNQRQKIDQENNILKLENEMLKLQLIKKQQQYQDDIYQIKSNYLQKNEINSIQQSSQKQNSDLQIEIKDLKEYISSNNNVQQQFIIDTLRQNQNYEIENQRLNIMIEDLNKRLLSQRQLSKNFNTESIKKIQDLQLQSQLLLEETNQKMKQINRENSFLNNKIVQKDIEISNFEDIQQKLNNYKQNLQQLQDENSIMLSHYQQQEIQIEKEKETQINQLQRNYESQLKQYDIKIQDLLNQKLLHSQILEKKNQECIDLNLQVKNLQNEIQHSKLKTLSNSQESKRIIHDPLHNLTQMKMMSEQISLLQSELLIKNQELTQIIDKYSQLEQTLCKYQIKQTDQNLNEIMKNQNRTSCQVTNQ